MSNDQERSISALAELYPLLIDGSDPAYQAVYDAAFANENRRRTVTRKSLDAFRQYENENNCEILTTLARKVGSSCPELIQFALLKNLDILMTSSNLYSLVGRRGFPKSGSSWDECVGLIVQRAANVSCWLLPFSDLDRHGLRTLDIAAECRRLIDADTDTDAKLDAAKMIQTFIWSAQAVYDSWKFAVDEPSKKIGKEDLATIASEQKAPAAITGKAPISSDVPAPYWYVHGLPESLKKLAKVLSQFGVKVDAHTVAQAKHLGADPSRIVSRLKRPIWKQWVAKHIAREEHGFWRLRTEAELSPPPKSE